MGVKHDEFTKRKDLTPYQRQNFRDLEHHKNRRYKNHKAYIENNPDKAKLYAFRGRLKRRGCSEQEYNDFLNVQNNLCGICQLPNSGKKEWAIDHCHTTGKVRGLLCRNCNLMIGYAKDNTKYLQKAIEYLNRYGN